VKKNLKISLFLVCLSLFLMTFAWSYGCGNSADTTKPTVASTYPQNGAESIPIFVTPTVTFSEAMDELSITDDNITLVSAGGSVTIGVSYDPDTKEVTIFHASDLTYDTQYTVTVSKLVRDSYGNAMSEDYTFTFTTSEQAVGTISWSNPLPQGNELNGVWSISATDIFAVGTNGTIVHSDGTTWSLMESNTISSLYAVWGLSSSNVYAAGSGGVIMHYDGSEWSVAHIDPDGETFMSIWGSSADDIHVGGQGGKIVYWNGTDWRIKQSGSISNIASLWGFSGNEVYAADWTSKVLRYDNTGWRTLKQFDNTTYMFNAVWGSSGSNLYVGGVPFTGSCQLFQYDGEDWSCIDDVMHKISGIWGTSANNVYAVGEKGAIYNYDGTSWENEGINYIYYYGISGSSASDIYTVGTLGSLNYYNGSEWSVQSGILVWTLSSIWGTATNNLYAVGQGGAILRYDGTSWEAQESPISESLYGISGSAANNIYAVGSSDNRAGYIVKYDGTSWEIEESYSDCAMMGVWAASDGKIFAASQDNVYRFDGAAWQTDTDVGPNNEINAVSGSSSSNVIVVGDGGFAKRYNGTSWETLDTGSENRFDAVVVFSETEAYAGDSKGNLYLFDGTNWTIEANPLGTMIRSLWGTSGTDLYLVSITPNDTSLGPESTLLHYDGTDFSQLDNLSKNALYGAWGLSADDVYFVGYGGTILHYEQ